ncbi:MAG: O-antigen ligase family protein [Melioribacteraceae bacterium]|nr:O-antigen ligase family protein [Melioribacteraceae bacterium]
MLSTRFNRNLVFYLVAAFLASFLISLALLQLFAAFLFFGWLAEKGKFKGADELLYLVLAFGVFRLLTIFLSEYFDTSIITIQKELLFYTTGLALFYYLKVFSREENLKLIMYFIHIGAVVALIGVTLLSIGHVSRAQSFGSGYATFSTYLVVVMVFVLSLNKRELYFNSILLWAIESGLIISGIILSMGRANIAIAFFLALIILIIRKVSFKKIGLVVLFGIVITFTALQFNPGESGKRVENPTALSDRDILIEGFFELADDHPFFGYGPRTFMDIFPYRERLADKKVGSWHNEYFQIYLDSGIFALLIFLVLFVVIMHKSKWLVFRYKMMKSVSAEEFAVTWSIIAMLLSGLTGAFLFSPVLSLLFVYLISLFSFLHYIKVD